MYNETLQEKLVTIMKNLNITFLWIGGLYNNTTFDNYKMPLHAVIFFCQHRSVIQNRVSFPRFRPQHRTGLVPGLDQFCQIYIRCGTGRKCWHWVRYGTWAKKPIPGRHRVGFAWWHSTTKDVGPIRNWDHCNDTSLGLWFVTIPYNIPVSDFDDCKLQA